MSRRVLCALAALTLCLTASCTGAGSTDTPDPTSAATSGDDRWQVRGEEPSDRSVELGEPIERNNVPTLLMEGPRRGSHTTTVDLHGGGFEILLNCIGGELTVDIEGVATLPFPCELNRLQEPKQYGARFNLKEAPGEVTVSMETETPTVQWRVHIGLLDLPPRGGT